jgi:hypothetical protein
VLAGDEHRERRPRREAHDRHAIGIEIARRAARAPERERRARVRERLVEATSAADQAVVDRGDRHARIRETRADEAHRLHVARAEDESAAVHEQHGASARATRRDIDVEVRCDAAAVTFAVTNTALHRGALVLDGPSERPERLEDRAVSELARLGHEGTVHNRA